MHVPNAGSMAGATVAMGAVAPTRWAVLPAFSDMEGRGDGRV
jgi:hypothetical protein